MRLSLARRARLIIGVVAAVTLLVARPAAPQFTSFSHDPRNILEGNWQSCRESDGRYAERVYDHVVKGEGKFELHMGPRREFAIFKGMEEQHRDHESPDNLLKPFRVLMDGTRASHDWKIPSLNLQFSVVMAGGARTDCESWFITLAPLDKTSH